MARAMDRPQKITFAEIAMRKAANAGKPAPEPTPRRRRRRWQACAKRGADVRPDFNWSSQPTSIRCTAEALRDRSAFMV